MIQLPERVDITTKSSRSRPIPCQAGDISILQARNAVKERITKSRPPVHEANKVESSATGNGRCYLRRTFALHIKRFMSPVALHGRRCER